MGEGVCFTVEQVEVCGCMGRVVMCCCCFVFFRKCIYVTVPGIRIHVAHFFQNRVITTVAKSKC